MTYDFEHDPLPASDRTQGVPRSIATLDGTVRLHVDHEAFDYHIVAKPDHNPESLLGIVTQAEWWGMEVMPEDECEAELLDDGSVRIYLAPIAVTGRRVPRQRSTNLVALALGSAAPAPMGLVVGSLIGSA